MEYDPACEGDAVALYAVSSDIYLSLGTVALVNGSTLDQSTEAWADQNKASVEYQGERNECFVPASPGELAFLSPAPEASWSTPRVVIATLSDHD